MSRPSVVGANGAYKNYVTDSRLVPLVELLDLRARQTPTTTTASRLLDILFV